MTNAKTNVKCNVSLRWEIKRQKQKQKNNKAVIENLWYKAKNVMQFLNDTKGEQNHWLVWANAKKKKTY